MPPTKQEVIEALEAHHGIIARAADQLKIPSQIIRRMVKADPELGELIESLQEDWKDLAEGVVLDGVRASNLKAAMFLLTKKARDRGYGNKIETESKVEVSGSIMLPDLSGHTDDQMVALMERLRAADKCG